MLLLLILNIQFEVQFYINKLNLLFHCFINDLVLHFLTVS